MNQGPRTMPETQPSSPRVSATRTFLTGAMITVGVLLVGLCGTCTTFIVGGALVQLAQGGPPAAEFGPGTVIPLGLTMGVPPILIGGLLIWFGRRLRRPKLPPSVP